MDDGRPHRHFGINQRSGSALGPRSVYRHPPVVSRALTLILGTLAGIIALVVVIGIVVVAMMYAGLT
jgi:hypothetical protein